MPEADAYFMPDVFDDTFLNVELEIPTDGDRPDFAKVAKHLRDKDGLQIGISHHSSILDTILYEVDYKEGNKSSLAANAIAENIFAHVNG